MQTKKWQQFWINELTTAIKNITWGLNKIIRCIM